MQKPLELILARNLLASLAFPAMLVDRPGEIVFYNEAAGSLLGVRFEEAQGLDPASWSRRHGPFDEHLEPIAVEHLDITRALRGGRPGHDRLCIREVSGVEHEIEASAFPIVGAEGFHGAIVIFWPVAEGPR